MGKAVDGAALLAVAIKTAISAKAPRRTIQAIAAVVTAVILRPETAASPGLDPGVPAEIPGTTDDTSEEVLMQRLRQARAARRKAKRQQRRANKATAAATDPGLSSDKVVASTATTQTSDATAPLASVSCGKRKTAANGDAEMTTCLVDTVGGKQLPLVVQSPVRPEAERLSKVTHLSPRDREAAALSAGKKDTALDGHRPGTVYPNTWEEAYDMTGHPSSRGGPGSASKGTTNQRAGQPLAFVRGKGPY